MRKETRNLHNLGSKAVQNRSEEAPGGRLQSETGLGPDLAPSWALLDRSWGPSWASHVGILGPSGHPRTSRKHLRGDLKRPWDPFRAAQGCLQALCGRPEGLLEASWTKEEQHSKNIENTMFLLYFSLLGGPVGAP